MTSASQVRNSQYLHGTAPREQARLARLNNLLNDQSLREMRLSEGKTVFDIGCGLGQLSRAMAWRVGAKGAVIGIERSADQLAEAARLAAQDNDESVVEFRQGEAIRRAERPEELVSS